MSEEAIRKLRRKFIFYAMLTLSIVMFLIAGMIYMVNVVVTRNEIRETMNFIVENDGMIQDAEYLYLADRDGAGESADASDDPETSRDSSVTDQSGTSGSESEQEIGGTGSIGSTLPDSSEEGPDSDNSSSGNAGESISDGSSEPGTQDGSTEAGTAGSTVTGNAPGRFLHSRSQTDRILNNLNQTIDQNNYDITRFLNDVFGTGSAEISNNSEDAFSTRYFAVIYGVDDSVEAIIANHISSLTDEEAEALGAYARSRMFHFGQYGRYYYQVSQTGDQGTMVVYLDSTDQINSTQRLFYSALILIGFGVIVTFIFVRIFSQRAIAPEIRNAELQKQFITNASHELKTPLAVIRANTEMQEILTGENEWTQSTLRQVDRLNGLIQNLVTITKAQEKETEERIPTDVSKIVNDVVETYVPVSQQDGKKMERNIPEGITMRAVDSEIRQLATLLLDNAIKYCDDNGTITTNVWQRGRETWISVSNNYAEGKDVDYTKFFERFYRKNEAHTIDGSGKENKEGYGIGLSIAESLVQKYNGSIRADWKDGVITFTCMLR